MCFWFWPYCRESEPKRFSGIRIWFVFFVCLFVCWDFFVCQSFSEHSSFQSVFPPVTHQHQVINSLDLCLAGAVAASSCRRLRQGCGGLPGAGSQLASTARLTGLSPLRLPLGPLSGKGWLWRTPTLGITTAFLIWGCIFLPVTFSAHVCISVLVIPGQT